MRGWWGACVAAAALAAAWACGDAREQEDRPFPSESEDAGTPDSGQPPAPPDSGPPDAGTPPTDGGGDPVPTPDAGDPPTDGGGDPVPPPDAGTPPPEPGPGPWPDEPMLNYSRQYKLGRVRSVGVDEAYNIWLLDGARIGVLRPGESTPRWTSAPIGQAAAGFPSTVICGGSAGRAYVGYLARELEQPERSSYRDPSFLEGDLDAVKLAPDGTPELEEHIHQSFRRNKESPDGGLTWNPPNDTGIRNSNAWRFDEDRSVFVCARVMRGRDQGDLYIGTNHGVTRLKGLLYNSHRHPVWWEEGSQRAGYTYGLGIAPNGDVLIANDWTFGIVTPNEDLGVWDWMSPKSLNPMKVESSFLPEVNSLAEFDYWRGFQQTVDRRYYLASLHFGLWEMTIVSAGDREQKGTRVPGLPTDSLTALASTDDGSLFIGTAGAGLWRMNARKELSRVQGLEGSTVLELLYDPTVKPSMLYVLTEDGLTVLRGH